MANYLMTLFMPRFSYLPQKKIKLSAPKGQGLPIKHEEGITIHHEGSEDFEEHNIYVLGWEDKGHPNGFGDHLKWRIVEPVTVNEKKIYWNQKRLDEDDEKHGILMSSEKVEAMLDDKSNDLSCSLVNEIRTEARTKSIGLSDTEKHPDWRIRSSSSQKGWEAYNGRIEGEKAWKPLETDGNPYIEVELGEKRSVEMLSIQGHGDCFITKFRVHHSENGSQWRTHGFVHQSKSNQKSGDVTVNYFMHPTINDCQSIRIYPLEWTNSIAVRLDIHVLQAGSMKPIYMLPLSMLRNTPDLTHALLHAGQNPNDHEERNVFVFDLPQMAKKCLDNLNVKYYEFTNPDDNDANIMLTISVPGILNQEVMDIMEDYGIGHDFGNMNVQNVTLRQSVGDKDPAVVNDVMMHRCACLTEILIANINDGGSITFDYIMYVTSAGLIAMIGLATDSVVSVVASMLVSPIMGPVLCLSFGACLKDGQMFMRGLWNEVVSMFLCMIIGFFGALMFIALDLTEDVYMWPTPQMAGRGTSRGLLEGTVVAAASGIGVGVAVMSASTNALVGVAISASLLPPVVNTGMLFAYAAAGKMSSKRRTEMLEAAGISCGLMMENVLLVFIVAFILFKVKEVLPNHHDSAAVWSMFTSDEHDEKKKKMQGKKDGYNMKTNFDKSSHKPWHLG